MECLFNLPRRVPHCFSDCTSTLSFNNGCSSHSPHLCLGEALRWPSIRFTSSLPHLAEVCPHFLSGWPRLSHFPDLPFDPQPSQWWDGVALVCHCSCTPSPSCFTASFSSASLPLARVGRATHPCWRLILDRLFCNWLSLGLLIHFRLLCFIRPISYNFSVLSACSDQWHE